MANTAVFYGSHINVSNPQIVDSQAGIREDSLEEKEAGYGSVEKGQQGGVAVHAVDSLEGKSIYSDSGENDGQEQTFGVLDPFPEDPNAIPEPQQFTFRAVFVGSILGGTGWTFGAGLFGSIFGFAIIKPLSKVLPEKFGGGYFGPKENVCVMSTATAAGSLGLLFASGFPAMYQLGLMGESPKADIGRLFTFTIACAYFGIFFTIPLRKFYILKLKLVFPSSVAAAYTIRSLHVGKNAEGNARKKTMCLLIAFCFAITWRVTSEYAPGIMWDWHWGYWFYRAGWKWIIRAENFYWVIEWTPAFIGCGLLVGLNSATSFLGGSVLAWGIIAPVLVSTGEAIGTLFSPEYPGYINMMGMTLSDPVHAPSPRYWLIWPGTLMLLCASFAEVGCNFKSIITTVKQMIVPHIARLRKTEDTKIAEDYVIEDPAPPHEQVPLWLWTGGVVISTIVSVVVMGVQFNQNAGVTLLAIVFAFLFSLIGAECCGRVSVIPVTSIGNASQLVFGGVSRGRHESVKDNQRGNSLSGMLALAASEQCADMLGDLKTTHLLGASPRVQLYAQAVGALVSIFMSAGMFVLFSTAYPCIIDLNASTTCSFPAPDVASWRAVAVAVSSPTLPIPPSSGYAAIGLGAAAVLTTIVKYRWVPPDKHHWVPNFNALGIAFILNSCTYPIAMFMGAVIAAVWKKTHGASHAMYLFPLAAGFIAGEGLGGIVNAVLQIAGVSGSVYGTTLGCPMGVYCG
ncbi:OPT oligopeptide transporter [Gloeophyllum trabeum ATCC 11539]|uniref:OPT oligopeptide transporter n=1 Tax=Gloeophyllum trabeum (strain ATCC 11539 / FP-39264 / Madison 617) TaxID=670483 RepID=S7Q5V7_GLOTA|nr:OPT oligopeptide transporter [Gloeophyllum trabeum ATCC 11539]EPQ54853.1 OPT oligopeptide transporter [Gloeophyllum trabeum ATCC 11539]